MTPGVLYAVLFEKVGAEAPIPGTETVRDGQLRFMIRVPRGNSTTMWLGVIRHILSLAKQSPGWSIDISKQYFITAESDLKYGWRIILQMDKEKFDEVVNSIAQDIRNVRIQGRQIEEVQLQGSPNRSRTAGLLGQVPIGPMAMRGGR